MLRRWLQQRRQLDEPARGRAAETVVVRVVDGSTWQRQALGIRGAHRVVLDLTAAPPCDRRFLAGLARVLAALRKRGVATALCGVARDTLVWLEVSQLVSLVEIHATEAAAAIAQVGTGADVSSNEVRPTCH